MQSLVDAVNAYFEYRVGVYNGILYRLETGGVEGVLKLEKYGALFACLDISITYLYFDEDWVVHRISHEKDKDGILPTRSTISLDGGLWRTLGIEDICLKDVPDTWTFEYRDGAVRIVRSTTKAKSARK